MRNRADLTGNKRVCDRGTCGACTMIVDGRTVYSCSMLAIEVQGKQIRTVDGLADGNDAAPGAAGVLRHTTALMCGFCTPGFVDRDGRAAREAPERRRPSRRAKALDGNICRCGTFVRILEAGARRRRGWPVADQQVAAKSRRRGPSRSSTRSTRGREAGAARHARSSGSTARTRSPAARSTPTTSTVPGCSTAGSSARRIAHARVVSIDLAAAEKAPGVKAALACEASRARKVMYQGDEVAAVAADTEEQARRRGAPDQGPVRGAAAPRDRRAGDGARRAGRVPGRQHRARARRRRPAISTPASSRPRTSSKRPTRRRCSTHVCLETHGCVCEWDGDKLTAWVSTQAVHGTRAGFAQALEIPQANVRVITAVHGRRLRQQVRPRRAGHHLREAGEAGRRAGQADARSQGRAPRRPATGRRRSRTSRPASTADGMLTAFDARELGHRRRRRRRRASRCRTSTSSRTAGARTRTSTSTPASSARCARRAIRRAASSPKS